MMGQITREEPSLQRNNQLLTFTCPRQRLLDIDPAQRQFPGKLYSSENREHCHLIRRIPFSEEEIYYIWEFCAEHDIHLVEIRDRKTNKGSRTNPIIIEDDLPGDSKENPIELD